MSCYVERVRATLQEAWSWHVGYGGASAFSRRLKVNRGYVAELLRSPNGPSIRTLGTVLAELGEDELAFARRVHALKAPESDPLALLDALPHRKPEPLPIKQLITAAKHLVVAAPARELSGRSANIEDAERLRRSNPNQAAEIAHTEALQARSWPLFCKAVGSYGSACRVGGNLQLAARAIRLGLRLADRLGAGERTRADMLVRASYIFSDHARYKTALSTTAEAKAIYAGLQDSAGEGKTLVDLGLFSIYRGQLKQAHVSYRAALEYLPPTELSNLRAAYWGLSELARYDGDLQTAVRWLRKAEDLEPQPLFDQARLILARGTLHRQSGHLKEAAQCFRRSRDILLKLNPYDSALAAVDLVEVLLDLGKTSEAIAEVRTMAPLIHSLRDNPIADATLHRFLLASQRGTLTQVIDRTRKELKRARARPLAERGFS